MFWSIFIEQIWEPSLLTWALADFIRVCIR